MPSAVSGRDTFCSTGKVTAVVSVLPGHKSYLHKASPSVSVGFPDLLTAVALADHCIPLVECPLTFWQRYSLHAPKNLWVELLTEICLMAKVDPTVNLAFS